MKIEYSGMANCPPEQVWEALAKTELWPRWSSLLERATWIEGPAWQRGSKLLIEVRQPQFKLKAAATEVSPPLRFVTAASVMGISIEHHFEFTGQPERKTLIRSWIKLSGPAVFFITEAKKKTGMELFSHWMNGLREHAERADAS